MSIRRWILLIPALLTVGAGSIHAQIETGGGDPASVRWMEQETPSFKILYPKGCEYLADEYGRLLEKYHGIVGASLGMVPGSLQYNKAPVILHAYSNFSNGSVVWAPRRMELYTLPEASGSDATPWAEQLAIHEQRHYAQMQFGYSSGFFRLLEFIFGEMSPGALIGIYPGQALLEGDAVVAETALTSAGRGRQAGFLNYYQVAYDNGDWRNWYRWRYGSYRSYAPDHYALGYQTIAGARVFFGDTLFMQRYFHDAARNPFRIGRFRHMLKKDAGTSFRKAFRQIQEGFHADWTAEREARAPFMPMDRLSAEPRFATNYAEPVFLDGSYYVLKASKVSATALVRIRPDGTEDEVRPFSGSTGKLHPDGHNHRLYWSEAVPDPRWSLGGTSRIRYLSTEDFKPHDLTREGRLFNPVPSPHDGSVIAAVSYPVVGGSEVVFLRADNGKRFKTLPAPAGVQITEVCWAADGLYALGLMEGGFCLWRTDGTKLWERLTEPVSARMEDICVHEKPFGLTFVSDLGGVDELYRFDPDKRTLQRLTSTPYGAAEFNLDGEKVVFVSMTPSGKSLFTTDKEALEPQEARFEPHAFRVADALSAQEQDLITTPAPPHDTLGFHEPVRYRRFQHLFLPHSWAPFAFDYDAVAGSSGDLVRSDIDPGVTILFQNRLGDFYGFANYAYHQDDLGSGRRRHSYHAQLTYTGLYPVLQARFSVGDRQRLTYLRNEIDYFGEQVLQNSYQKLAADAVEASFKAYVPLSFSKSGWNRGLIPQLSWSISNDIFSRERLYFRYANMIGDAHLLLPEFLGNSRDGKSVPVQGLSLSLRGYAIRPTAGSQVYPSLGIGAEVGGFLRPGLTDFFTPSLYGYVYGYLPGLLPQQGLRLSATVQHLLKGEKPRFAESRMNLQPRGFTSTAGTLIEQKRGFAGKLTADYAIPFSLGDISFLSPLIYIPSFALTPYADVSWGGGKDCLVTLGAELSARFSNFLFVPLGGSFGVCVEWNGGTLFDEVRDQTGQSRITAGLSYSMDF